MQDAADLTIQTASSVIAFCRATRKSLGARTSDFRLLGLKF
jgi:hypothetical protein